MANPAKECAQVLSQIPRLEDFAWERTSDKTGKYNCFAWAGGDEHRVWSPTALGGGVYWPPGIPALPTLAGAIDAYEREGFERCDNSLHEDGYVKIALFADALNEPRHAARQLPDGTWTSKLGDHIDIWHEKVEAVGGVMYGEPKVFMRREGDPAAEPTGVRPSASGGFWTPG